MAIDIWKGPGGTAGSPTNGDFFTASNWSGGFVPGSTTDAVLGAGNYTVTMTGAAAELHSINIGAGATIALTGNTTSLILDTASVNTGTIRVSGAYFQATENLVNLGAFYGDVSSNFAATIGGSITNDGVISSTPGASLGYVAFSGTVTNETDGLITTLAGPGQVILGGTSTNSGRIVAVGGGVVTTSLSVFNTTAHGTVTNVDGGTLSGGTWVAETNSSIWLAGTTISRLADGATVTLDGEGSNFRIDDGSSDPFYIEQTLSLVDTGATLEILGGRDWTTTEHLDVRGTLHLGGGTFAPGDLRTDKDSVMTGFGTVASQTIVDGLLKVDGGQTLEFTTFADFNGKIVGGGTLALTGGEDTFTTSKVGVKHLLFDGADVRLDQSLKYAGELTVTTGTIELKDSALTLAGKATIGTAMIHGGPGGRLTVTGDLRAHDGVADIEVRTIKIDGEASVDHGTLRLNGTVTGSGGIEVGAQGTLELGVMSKLSAGPLVTLSGPNATLVIDNNASGSARVANFDGHDRIDFAAVSGTGVKVGWRADADGSGGTLKVSNGGQTATVHLEENHTKADFALKTDAGGGTVVTLAKTAAFGLVDAGAFGESAPAGGHLFAGSHDLHGMLALA